MPRIWPPWPLLAAALAFISAFTRQTGVPKAWTMWAEDGYVFLGCHTRGDSLIDCLGEAYGGYLHVVPRLGAMLAWLGPPDVWSVAVTTAAAAILGACAFLVAGAVEGVTGSALAGLLGGVALGLPFEAGHEVVGNLANLHWILFVTAIVLVVAAWLGRAPAPFDVAAVAGFALSSALGPIVAAMAFLGVLARRSGSLRLAAAATIGSVVQAGVAVTVPRDPPLHDPVGLADALRAFVGRVLIAGPFGPAALGPGWALAAVAFGVAAVIVVAAPSRRARALAAMAGLAGAGLAGYVTAVLVNRWIGPRYEYVPGVLLIEAAVVGAALLGAALGGEGGQSPRTWHNPRLARLPLFVVIALVTIGAASSYRIESRTSGGPDYAVGYAAAVAGCEAGIESVRVRISPWPSDRAWTVEVPCERAVSRRE